MSYRSVLAGVVCATLLAGSAMAQEVRQLTPANVLVMPFDVTAGKASFQIVSRVGPSLAGAPLQTHWVFYAADCRHLVNVNVSLTERDSIVMDPRAVRGQTQSINPPVNNPVGAATDLSGERGVVIVTAVGSFPDQSAQIFGGWVIADTSTHAAFGADAMGILDADTLPDPTLLDGGLYLPSFDPSALEDSQIIAIGVESEGEGVVPIGRPADALDGAHVCCDVGFIDVLEAGFSLPTFCFDCVGFAAIAGTVAGPDEVPLIPPSTAATSAGMIELRNCRTSNIDGSTDPLGQGEFQQFLFAYHGQAVGPFGAAISGKYEGLAAPPM